VKRKPTFRLNQSNSTHTSCMRLAVNIRDLRWTPFCHYNSFFAASGSTLWYQVLMRNKFKSRWSHLTTSFSIFSTESHFIRFHWVPTWLKASITVHWCHLDVSEQSVEDLHLFCPHVWYHSGNFSWPIQTLTFSPVKLPLRNRA